MIAGLWNLGGPWNRIWTWIWIGLGIPTWIWSWRRCGSWCDHVTWISPGPGAAASRSALRRCLPGLIRVVEGAGAFPPSAPDEIRRLESSLTLLGGRKVAASAQLAFGITPMLSVGVCFSASPADGFVGRRADVGAVPESAAAVTHVHLLAK